MAKRIYVGNLPWSYASSDLEALFKQYGDVAAAEVIMDRETGRSRGFGFVQMANDADMDAAIDGLNGHDCGGRPLVVNEARERTPAAVVAAVAMAAVVAAVTAAVVAAAAAVVMAAAVVVMVAVEAAGGYGGGGGYGDRAIVTGSRRY